MTAVEAELQTMRADLAEAECAYARAVGGRYLREGERERLVRVCEVERERMRRNLAEAEAMADYADYARKRDKENALTGRGAGRRGDLGDCREAGSNPLVREPRSVSAFRCTRDDIDETGGAA